MPHHNPRLPPPVSRVRDRRADGQEFYIQIHLSPKAVSVMVVILTVVTNTIQGAMIYLIK